MKTCEFALCRRDGEMLVELDRHTALVVCGLHVTPVLSWGLPGAIVDPKITYLPGRPESGEAA